MEVSDEDYVIRKNKRLRKGHTTGSCAAAAAAAAAEMALTNKESNSSTIKLPNGDSITLPVLERHLGDRKACCAVRKDAGDDPDVTHGHLVFAEVSLEDDEGIVIEGGQGVGRVTRKGLDQAIGQAAINAVPRRMISSSVSSILKKYGHRGGAKVVISIPGGSEIAKKTFNPRLGIEGGLSILGTTGIVEPMSENAIIETVRTEIRVQLAEGIRDLVITPGNYGATYAASTPRIRNERAIKCSNFIGETIDYASDQGAHSLLIIGNIGKLVKLAAGIMNTHSRYADGRMEIIAAHAAMIGASREQIKSIMDCITTDDALDILHQIGLKNPTIDSILMNIHFHLVNRAGSQMRIGAIMHSSKYGMLGCTEWTDEILRNH